MTYTIFSAMLNSLCFKKILMYLYKHCLYKMATIWTYLICWPAIKRNVYILKFNNTGEYNTKGEAPL